MTNQNSIQLEIKYRLKAGNSCYYSVQTLLPSRLLSKNFKIKIYKTIILPVVLYGCETWSITLREECRILRRIFRAKRVENGEWRRLYNEELNTLYRSPNIVKVIKSRRLKWGDRVSTMEEGRSAIKILIGNPTGKRPLGRPRRTGVDNIRMDLKEIGINTRNWVVRLRIRIIGEPLS